ncbi:MAG: hypothetical protein ACYTGR_08835 [Planctomycetota bacterium]|jgi:hypothetical protein
MTAPMAIPPLDCSAHPRGDRSVCPASRHVEPAEPTNAGRIALDDALARLRACERNCRATRVDRVEIEHVDLPAPEAGELLKRSEAARLDDLSFLRDAPAAPDAPEQQAGRTLTTPLGTLMDVFG